ncbi:MAG TPA: GNAT family N-acetyltransferase [Thermoplasmata archaeon]|nr:GNAT family N-acetyltransferase [Thermoplasmata archaeon]
MYHPFPFRRWLLVALFSGIVLERPISRQLVRILPQATIVLLVAHQSGTARPIGFCTVRFPRSPDRVRKALFGTLVAPEARGLGVGKSLLAEAKKVGRAHGARFLTAIFLARNRASTQWAQQGGMTVAPTSPDRHAPGEANFFGEQPL